MTSLFKDIDNAIAAIGHGWTSVEKGQTMAAMVLALRPMTSLEIGVYAGKGLVSLGLAHKAINFGTAVGIDPYSTSESVRGQVKSEDKDFWATVDHESIFNTCKSHISRLGIESCTRIMRQTSDQVTPPREIGILRIDGNHAETAFRDTMRFAPSVVLGGFVLLDDVGWSGGHVSRAASWLKQTGWRELYFLEDGPVFQRIR